MACKYLIKLYYVFRVIDLNKTKTRLIPCHVRDYGVEQLDIYLILFFCQTPLQLADPT